MPQRVLPIIFGTLLLDMIGIGMLIPIIPIIFTDPTSPSFLLEGYSKSGQYFIAGLITALFGLMQFIASPILGELSDVYGRKRLLTLGVAVLGISQVLFGIGIELGLVWLLLVSRTVAGLAGANLSIAQASIADVTEPKNRARNFGLIGAAFGIGFILGPLLGGLIASVSDDPAMPFWVAGVLGMINVLFVTFFLPETHGRSVERKRFTWLKGIHNIRAAFKDVDARPVYSASFFYLAGFTFFTSFSGVLLPEKFGMTEAGIGTFFAVVGIWIVITQAVILRYVTRIYSERTILRVSLLMLAATLAVYPFMPSVFALYAILPFLTIPQGLSMANMSALISKSVSADKQGAALGINGSLVALAQGVIPLLAGVGSGVIAIEAPFVAGAVFVVIAWCFLFVWGVPRKGA